MKTKTLLFFAVSILLSTTVSKGQTWTYSAPYLGTSSPINVNGKNVVGDLSSGDSVAITALNFTAAIMGVTHGSARHALFGTSQTTSDILFVNYVNSTYDYYERMRINRWGRVGIGTSAPDTSALLDVSSTNKGVLIPRIELDSTHDGLSIILPATSLLVYNTGTGGLTPAGYWYNAGTSASPNWVQLATTLNWQLNGNAGTTASTAAIGSNVNNNFIGTTDSIDWVVATRNRERMRVKANGNVGIGTSAPANRFDVYNTDGTIEGANVTSVVSGINAGGATFRVDASPTATSNITNFASAIITLRNKGTQGITNLIGVSALQVLAFNNTTAGTVTNLSAINLNNTNTSTGNITNMISVYTRTATNSGGGTVTNFYGNRVMEQTVGTTLNIGYASEIAAGTGRYNCYMIGTAKNYFAGDVGIGTTTPGVKLDVAGAARLTSSAADLYLTSTGTGAGTWRILGATNTRKLFRIYDQDNTADRFNIDSAGNVGIGFTGPTYKLDVNGTTQCTGNIWTSDQQFKTNVDSVHSALAIIHQLKPKSYYFDTTNVYGFNFQSKKQYGFIAQEVEQILPELVFTATKHEDVDSSGNVLHPAVTYKSLSYIAFIPILTKGIQELQQKNDSLLTKLNADEAVNNSLQEQNTSLQNQVNQLTTNVTSIQDQLTQLLSAVNNCCSTTRSMQIGSTDAQTQSSIQQMDVKLNDVQSVILEQNVPNPFAEQTTINYTLPDNTAKAQMLFYNSQGKLIQSVELVQKGKGQLNVFASDLTNGVYTYTLVVDGKVIATKKMIKQ